MRGFYLGGEEGEIVTRSFSSSSLLLLNVFVTRFWLYFLICGYISLKISILLNLLGYNRKLETNLYLLKG